MIVVEEALEGEPLIRYLARANADEHFRTLLWKAADLPSPSVPQIVARAGIDRLVIERDHVSHPPFTFPRFTWYGIDGTTMEVYVGQRGSDTVTVKSSEAQSEVWYGELPGAPTDCVYSTPRSHSVEGDTGFRACIESDQWPLPIDTRGLKLPVFVASNLSFFANEVVSVPIGPSETPVAAIGPEGDAEPVQIAASVSGRDALFIAKNLPLHGYAVWDLAGTSVPVASEDEVLVSPTLLENNEICVEFDRATGLITSIFDKDNERELLGETFTVQANGRRDLNFAACANLIDLTIHAAEEHKVRLTSLDDTTVVESGPVRGAIRFTRSLLGGSITVRQTVRLTSMSARIDFVTEIDSNGASFALSASFPVAINGRHARFAVPCGYVERSTCLNAIESLTERKRYDGHWVDFSEGDYGVGLLADRSGALDVCGSVMTARMRRGGSSDGDAPKLNLTYSLLPHGGDLRDGEVVENACAITDPPSASLIKGNCTGSYPLARSFFEVDNAAVFIDRLKRSERDQRQLVVRLHEAHNTRGQALLTTTLPVKRAWLCDLLENELAELSLDNGEALIPIHPFEIITLKYQL